MLFETALYNIERRVLSYRYVIQMFIIVTSQAHY